MATTIVIDDPWDLLGVSRETPLEDIRQQRNALALASHPDRCPDPALKETWTARMSAINQAFTLATDAEEWVKYKRHHQLEDEEDVRAWQQQHRQGQQVSERVARGRQHEAAAASSTTTTTTNATAKTARAQRRRNLQARADDIEEAFADGTCTAEARSRWTAYFSRQEANNSEVLETRVDARVERDAEEVRETRRFAARAAIGSYDEDADAAALLTENGGAWTAEELVAESLGALEVDEGSHKQRRVARRMLVGEMVERRRRLQVEWGQGQEQHGVATLGSGPAQLRIEEGDIEESEDAEMEALEQERREGLQKLEQYAETKKFRAQWVGTLGNDAPVKTISRPPNRKELRQMNKEMKKRETGKT